MLNWKCVFVASCRSAVAAWALTCLALAGCSDPYANEKKCYKIVGTITVDGKPASGLQLSLHSTSGVDQTQPTFPQGQTDAEGKVKFSTYADGDGAPPGEYKVTASWQEFNPISRGFSGPDKLKKKYSDPAKTTVTIKVTDKSPNDIGTIDLTTK
jgi:5-hydroxyisourate hydrolase-like protein (transthyretin family)